MEPFGLEKCDFLNHQGTEPSNHHRHSNVAYLRASKMPTATKPVGFNGNCSTGARHYARPNLIERP